MADNVTEAEALKPCPFCGGEPVAYEGRYTSSVKCDNGHAIHEYKPTLAQAIAAWNTRAFAKEATPSASVERDALPAYGDWLPEAWEAYLRDLVGWEYADRWAKLPATFRWHEFHEKIEETIATLPVPSAPQGDE